MNPFTQLKGVAVPSSPAKTPEAKPPEPLRKERNDLDLFLEAMADVRRIREPRKPVSPAAVPLREKPLVRRLHQEEQQLFLEVIQQLKLDVVFHDELPQEEAPVRQRPLSRLRQLRRGTITIDYELDLHGLTSEQALDALVAFIGGAFRRGQQAVLVITGRGIHSPGEPVLQTVVIDWLRGEGREMVAEYAVAPRQLGGDGAVVAFLHSRGSVTNRT